MKRNAVCRYWILVAALLLTTSVISIRADMPDDWACVDNLRLINAAKEELRIDRNLKDGDSVDLSMLTPYFRKGKIPSCPAGGAYTIGPIGTMPACSIKSHTEFAVQQSVANRNAPPFPWLQFMGRFTAMAIPTFTVYYFVRRWIKSRPAAADPDSK